MFGGIKARSLPDYLGLCPRGRINLRSGRISNLARCRHSIFRLYDTPHPGPVVPTSRHRHTRSRFTDLTPGTSRMARPAAPGEPCQHHRKHLEELALLELSPCPQDQVLQRLRKARWSLLRRHYAPRLRSMLATGRNCLQQPLGSRTCACKRQTCQEHHRRPIRFRQVALQRPLNGSRACPRLRISRACPPRPSSTDQLGKIIKLGGMETAIRLFQARASRG